MPAAKPSEATPANRANTAEKVDRPTTEPTPPKARMMISPIVMLSEQPGDRERQQRAGGCRGPEQGEDGSLARRGSEAADDAEHQHLESHGHCSSSLAAVERIQPAVGACASPREDEIATVSSAPNSTSAEASTEPQEREDGASGP